MFLKGFSLLSHDPFPSWRSTSLDTGCTVWQSLRISPHKIHANIHANTKNYNRIGGGGPRGSIVSRGDLFLWMSIPFGDKLHFWVWALVSTGSCGGSHAGRREATSSFGSSAGADLGPEAHGGVQPTLPPTLPCVQPRFCFRWQNLSPTPLSCLLHQPLTNRNLSDHWQMGTDEINRQVLIHILYQSIYHLLSAKDRLKHLFLKP